MVQPINYNTDVLNPIQGYLQGLKFGEGLNTDRLNQQATTQSMGIQREQMDLQLRQYEDAQRARAQAQAAARAQAAAAQRQAVAGRDALLGYLAKLEDGTATPADLRRGIAENPQLADQFQAFASSVSEERLSNELGFGRQLSFALANDNTEAAENLLRTRQEAARAAGDERTAAGYQAQLIQLQENPKGLLMQTLMPMASTLPTDEFDSFYNDILGLGGAEMTTGFQTLDQRARAAGYEPGTPEYQQFMAEGSAPQTNINVNTGESGPRMGTIPQGFVAVDDPSVEGGVRLVRIAGGPEDTSGAAAAASENLATGSVNVLGVLGDLREQIAESPLTTTGFAGRLLSNVAGTGAYDAEATTRTLKANLAFDALAAMRAASPTGGALGAVSERELGLLESQIASLDLGQSTEQILGNIARVQQQYTRLLNKAYETGDPAALDAVFGGRPDFVDLDVAPSGAGSTSVTRLKFNPETGEFE